MSTLEKNDRKNKVPSARSDKQKIIVQSKSRKNTNMYALSPNVEVMTGTLELRNKKTGNIAMKETIENVLVKTDENENVSISLLE